MGHRLVDCVPVGHVGTREVVRMSAAYWETRYASGGDSGSGSEGTNRLWKAQVINDFVASYGVRDVIEYGCGDGRQLEVSNYPQYLGLDVSKTAIEMCEAVFAHDPTKTFHTLPLPWPVAADLVLSLDVIYHLVEDDVFEQHIHDVFATALHWVILYTTDSDYIDPGFVPAPHVKHRYVAHHVEKNVRGWRLENFVLNPAPRNGGCDFYIYGRP